MSVQSRFSDMKLFNAGIGVAIGVGTVLGGQPLWLAATGHATGSAIAAVTQPVSQLTPAAIQHSVAQQAAAMGLPLVGATKAYWYAARAGGILAYLLLWFGALWGIMMSSKVSKGLFIFGLHEFLPILAAVFAALHGLALLGDQYIDFSLFDVVIPFAAPYRPVWTGLGQVAFYLSVAIIASFYVKSRIGRKTWRTLHYATYLAFFLALGHGLLAGTDSTLPAIRGMYIISAATLIFATFFRILTVRGDRKPAPSRSQTAMRPALPGEPMLAPARIERRPAPRKATE
jgi:DMSO/TMAO reductase YedYZ heme-binding membrane subunit